MTVSLATNKAYIILCDITVQANDEYNRATQIANGVMSAYILLYIVTGSLPAIMLSRMVYKKITRLEDSSRGELTPAPT